MVTTDWPNTRSEGPPSERPTARLPPRLDDSSGGVAVVSPRCNGQLGVDGSRGTCEQSAKPRLRGERTGATGLWPVAIIVSASRSFLMICSGLCFLPFIESPPARYGLL